MKIIDAHIHTNFNDKVLFEIAKKNKIKYSLAGLKNEMKMNKVMNVVSITNHLNLKTPMGLEEIKKQCSEMKSIVPCVGINPFKAPIGSIKKLKELILQKHIKAIKIYLGYFPAYANNKRYLPFYRLAGEHDIPVIFHTGDTLGSYAKLKYSLPLRIDDLAVDFPKTTFIIAHMGNPWMIDAEEVVYKNENVFADVSGLFIGSKFSQFTKTRLMEALDYIDNYDKILYGSDWPLVKMKNYIRFIKTIIPKKYHKKVFYKNAKKLFRLK